MTALDALVVGGASHPVRRAAPGDIPALVALLADDAIAASRGDRVADGDDLEPYRRAFALIDADPRQLLVCLDDPAGVLVGTLQLTTIPGLSRRGATRAQIEAVRVATGARGRGLGGALIRWAVERARTEGATIVQLTTDARRHDAHRFYGALGFEPSHWGFKLTLDPADPTDPAGPTVA